MEGRSRNRLILLCFCVFFSLSNVQFCLCESIGSQQVSSAGNGERFSKNGFRDDFDSFTVDQTIWQIASWVEHGGRTGPERCFIDPAGRLNLVFRNDGGTFLGSAIQTRKEFLFGRWEARLKPSSVSGVLNSLYTIDWDNTSFSASESDGSKQEIDLEFLTRSFGKGRGEAHFSLHEEGKRSVEFFPDYKLDFDPSADFHIWGIDITPEYVEWFVDGKSLRRYPYAEGEIRIDAPYQLKMNAWTRKDWVGGPPSKNIDCVFLIDWISFTPGMTK